MKEVSECGDQIKSGGKIFTCREVKKHRIHDDHEVTDGYPMKWLDTSRGRIRKKEVTNDRIT